MEIVIKQPKVNYNITQENHFLLAWKYLLWFFLMLVSLYLLFYLFGWYLTFFVSIEDENRYFSGLYIWLKEDKKATNKLISQIWQSKYNIKVIDSEEINAFSALWWNIFLTNSLYSWLNTIEWLDFVIGHEIKHIENRDVFKSLVSQIPVKFWLLLIWVDWTMLNMWDVFTVLYSKNQEILADYGWVDYVYEKHWHVGCIQEVFDLLPSNYLNELISDHPVTESRISKINSYIISKWYKTWECAFLDKE